MKFAKTSRVTKTMWNVGGRLGEQTKPSKSGAIVDAMVAKDLIGHHRLRDTFRVIEKIGEGGIGVVYLVEHVVLQKKMALKVLRTHVQERLALVRRFRKEVLKLAKLSHPHTVAFFDGGRLNNGDVYVLMEYIEGIDLEQFLSRGLVLSTEQIIELGWQICQGLRHAHDKGIFHQDLKASNVMLCPVEGESVFVKLLDFGLTSALSSASAAHRWDESSTAPELLQGEAATPRSDIYALAALLFRLLTGERYWPACDRAQLLCEERFQTDPSSEYLRKRLWQALSVTPAHRQPSVEAFATELQAALEHLPNKTQTTLGPKFSAGFALSTEENPPPTEPAQILTPEEWTEFRNKHELLSWSFRVVLVLLGLGAIFGMVQTFINKLEKSERTHTSYEHESNDTWRRSTAVSQQHWVHGTLGCAGCKRAYTSTKDIDWYRFRVEQARKTLSVRLLAPDDAGVSIALYKGRGAIQPPTRLTSSHHIQAHEIRIPAITLKKGMYYIKIRTRKKQRSGTKAMDIAYRWRVAALRRGRGWEVEPNQDLATATPTKWGERYKGLHDLPKDVDLFRFNLPDGAALARLQRSCPACIPKRERTVAQAQISMFAPLFRLRFVPVAHVAHKLEILDARGRSTRVLQRASPDSDALADKGEIFSHKSTDRDYPRHSEKGQHIDLFFAGKGRHFFRVTALSGFQYKRSYTWRLVLYAVVDGPNTASPGSKGKDK